MTYVNKIKLFFNGKNAKKRAEEILQAERDEKAIQNKKLLVLMSAVSCGFFHSLGNNKSILRAAGVAGITSKLYLKGAEKFNDEDRLDVSQQYRQNNSTTYKKDLILFGAVCTAVVAKTLIADIFSERVEDGNDVNEENSPCV